MSTEQEQHLQTIQALGQEMEREMKWRAVHQEEFLMPDRLPTVREKYLSSEGVELSCEDGGQAIIANPNSNGEDCMFVRLQSWEEDPRHKCPDAHFEMVSLLGKRVRIRVEVLDD